MSLNPAQKSAVEHSEGPLLVLAGAGSGKTRVITQRIARLVERGTRPESILAVSFTNKAAAEMAERMVPLVGRSTADKLWLSTFHSFGVRFLSEEASRKKHGGKFVIFDQGDSLGLVREILRRHRLAGDKKLDAASLLARISIWKNRFLAPSEVPENEFEYDAVARVVYPDYEASLRTMHAVDFDDLVVVPVRMLGENEEIRERWRNKFRYLLIDEFQDTNRAQLELVRLLANAMRNVCVVGDDDQSIYGWRGADVGNILDFEKHFPGALVVKLEDNYRSKAQVLDVANAAIANSPGKRHGKTLRAARGDGDPVRLVVVPDTATEAKFVANEILDLVKARIPFKEIAILYRSNLQSRLVEEELRAAQIPVRMFGGTQFFDRKEVKDAAAYLRLVVNPRDELALRRIVNYPARGIGDVSVAKMEQSALIANVPLAVAFEQGTVFDGLPDNAKNAAHALRDSLARAREEFEKNKLAAAARSLFASVGFKEDLAAQGEGKVAARRNENLDYLLMSIERYESSEREGKPSLSAFLQRITMRMEQAEEDAGNRVTLSTLHAAKGLEFGYVFLIGCVEGQLPHTRTTDPKITEAAPTDVEEERRLFYVGVTRAKDRLYLTRPQRKTMRGRTMPVTPSRFLDGLPERSTTPYERKDVGPMDHDEVANMASAILAKLQGL